MFISGAGTAQWLMDVVTGLGAGRVTDSDIFPGACVPLIQCLPEPVLEVSVRAHRSPSSAEVKNSSCYAETLPSCRVAQFHRGISVFTL